MPSTGPVLPQNFPQTTRTCVPSSSVTSGISSAFTSWYRGAVIFREEGRFAHNWKPCMRPAESPLGISWWMIPLPAVIHWTSPGDRTVIAHAVSVFHGAGKYVSNRLDAAVRMPRKARQVVRGHVVAKIVEQQERIKFVRVAEAKRAPQVHARALNGWLGPNQLFHRTQGHGCLLRRMRCTLLGCRFALKQPRSPVPSLWQTGYALGRVKMPGFRTG